MPAEVVWSNRARESLLDIYVAIGADNPTAADRICSRIEARAGRLCRHPRMGPQRPDIGPAVRMLVERPYLILYEITPHTDDEPIEKVEIVNVVDGRRDLSKTI